MNKMAKGALAIGLGSALLLGGGGTLAVWNQTQSTNAGTIASGELKMTAPAVGAWASNMTSGPIRVADYKMVPGEKLTFTQDLAITLVGDRITANLKTTDAVAKAFGNEATITIEYSTNNGTSWTPAATGVTAIPLQLAAGTHNVKARMVVDFTNITTAAGNTTASMAKPEALSGVGFKLEQNVPSTTAATQAPVAP